ncbi:hypothetical protein PIB30_083378 [Stylosanthes scabra]|uniref:Uncharacterized protein n=1 Tax=Stylosanthes scabra TaxID=79078 RepID=A0ABU6TV26_9FABA|nr:hypothetical protein [Stylosanthes scabra]
MGRPTLNRLGAVIATSILTMKFITDGGRCLLVDLEPPKKKMQERPKPKGDLQQVQIGQRPDQVTMIAKNLPEKLKESLAQFLKRNFSSHKLSIIYGSKPVAQKLQRMSPEKVVEIKKQV